VHGIVADLHLYESPAGTMAPDRTTIGNAN
jgi:hypothetical protein